MAFSPSQKRSIKAPKECLMCSHKRPLDAVHIIDEMAKPSVNGIYLCKNCHSAFEDILRPYLYKALQAFDVKSNGLPPSWARSNKISNRRNRRSNNIRERS